MTIHKEKTVNIGESINRFWDIGQHDASVIALTLALRERCAELGLEGLRNELAELIQQIDLAIKIREGELHDS